MKASHLAMGTRHLKDLQDAVDQTSIIAITDPEGKIVYANSKFCQLSKYSFDELLGQDHRIINSGFHSQAFFKGMWTKISQGEIWRGDIRNRAKDGSHYWVDTTIVPFLGEDGRPERYFSMRTDITEKILARQRQEREKHTRVHMQKLEALGTLAGGVAHDFNNILQGLSMGLQHLSRICEQEEQLETIDDLSNLTVRGKEMVRQILTFSRKKATKLQAMSLTDLLQELHSMMTMTLPAQVKLKYDVDGTPEAFVKGDSTQLLQVFINLCTNAAYVMKDKGGVIGITLQKVAGDELGERFLPKAGCVDKDFYYRVRIQDTGPGIPEDVRERIFEPFFTTKPVGEGTGMGLSVVHGIIASHRGDIYLHPYDGSGAIFDLYLPGVEKPQELLPSEAPQSIRTRASAKVGRVLLVDDDLMIERFGGKLLEDLGYEVVTASGGQDALDILRKGSKAFDALITDLTMPEMNGIELARKVKSLYNIPILLATGNLDQQNFSTLSRVGIDNFIEKPFSAIELKKKLQQLLNP